LGKQRIAGPDHRGSDEDLDLVEGAALEEGHLQPAAADHPDVSVFERPQFCDQRVDVGARFDRRRRIDDRPGRDDYSALLRIGPRLPGADQPVVGGASHHDRSNAGDEQLVVMVAEGDVTTPLQPLQRLAGISDEAIKARGDVSDNACHR